MTHLQMTAVIFGASRAYRCSYANDEVKWMQKVSINRITQNMDSNQSVRTT